jgi:hypothetical protein
MLRVRITYFLHGVGELVCEFGYLVLKLLWNVFICACFFHYGDRRFDRFQKLDNNQLRVPSVPLAISALVPIALVCSHSAPVYGRVGD